MGRIDGQPLYPDPDGGISLADGGTVLQRRGAGWQPVAPPGRRIELDDGSYWVTLGFTTDGEEARPRWVPPAHSAREVAERLAELSAESEKLPPEWLLICEPPKMIAV